MSETTQAPDSLFETVLASTVHDMKNSLSLLMARLEDITLQLEQQDHLNQPLAGLRYEAGRINLSLMQMLSLYKLDKQQLKLNPVEVDVIEFVEDCIASHASVAGPSGIALDYDCDEELLGRFDRDLIGIAINNVIGNSIRYSRHRVLLQVQPRDQGLEFIVADDGQGYPESMIENQGNYARSIDSSTGSTGLGLFFSDTVARMHRRDGRSGSIKLQNGEPLGGGCFRLFIP